MASPSSRAVLAWLLAEHLDATCSLVGEVPGGCPVAWFGFCVGALYSRCSICPRWTEEFAEPRTHFSMIPGFCRSSRTKGRVSPALFAQDSSWHIAGMYLPPLSFLLCCSWPVVCFLMAPACSGHHVSLLGRRMQGGGRTRGNNGLSNLISTHLILTSHQPLQGYIGTLS